MGDDEIIIPFFLFLLFWVVMRSGLEAAQKESKHSSNASKEIQDIAFVKNIASGSKGWLQISHDQPKNYVGIVRIIYTTKYLDYSKLLLTLGWHQGLGINFHLRQTQTQTQPTMRKHPFPAI